MTGQQIISALGLVSSGKRTIKNGQQYEKYFEGEIEGNEVELLADGDVYDTLSLMKKIVASTLPQTNFIAHKLKGSSLEQTCKNIWSFLYNNVQYKKDNPLREQLRTPLRTWKDRRSGVDCDCYSIFISSVLTNLHVPHVFRMAAYKGDFQHVYVIVPKVKTIDSRSSYYVIDPVVDQFDYETPFSKKYDMTKVTMLNGLGECNTKPISQRVRRYIDTQTVIDRGYVPTMEFLESKKIPFQSVIDEKTEGGMLLVKTASGTVKVPTIITQEQADSLLSTVQPETPCTCNQENQDNKKFPWWWVAAGVGAYLILFGSDQNEVSSGLDGIKKGVKKVKPKKKLPKRVKTLHI